MTALATRAEELAAEAARLAAAGDAEAAADAYLRAYEAKPLLAWLEAACGLRAVQFVARARHGRPPWPLLPAQRMWMYSAIHRGLATKAPPGEDVAAGCPHTLRWGSRFADEAAVDRVALYQSLAARASFCDCEILAHAGAEDEPSMATVFLAGDFDGLGAAARARLSDLVVDGAPPPLGLGASADDDTCLDAVFLAPHPDGTGLRAAPQIVDGAVVGDVLDALACAGERAGRVTLLLGYPDRKGAMDVASFDGKRRAFASVDRRALSPALADCRWLVEGVAAFSELLAPLRRGGCA